MKRRLILHLGLPKTGTTSIQTFLRENPDFLAAHGVTYPDLAGERSSHPALAPSTLRRHPERNVNHDALAMEIRQGSRAADHPLVDAPLWSGVLGRIESGVAHTAIISYENFYQRPDLYRFDVLADSLSRFEITGLIYLRRQENWAVSLYAQTIKGATRTRISLTEYMARRRASLLYSQILDDISKHIPIDRLIIGDFDQASCSGLLTDFMNKIGVASDRPVPGRSDVKANRSLPGWATLFLLKCNQARVRDEIFVKVRRVFNLMTPDEAPALRPGLDVATPAERVGLRETAAADADRLQSRYGVTLAQKLDEPFAYRPFDAEDVSAIRSALAKTLGRSALDALDEI